jgi:hypothetical protein
MSATPLMSSSGEFHADPASFYRHVLQALRQAEVPFLLGGAFVFTCYTGIERPTKDVDIFIRAGDYDRLRQVLFQAGYETELTFPHWLAKVRSGDLFLDVIFGSGNGLCEVDDDWFAHAWDAELLGMPVKTAPVEETIWSKAFVMERERYDGADIAHLVQARAEQIDWRRLLERFGEHWRVLLTHLLLFGYIYPAQRSRVPAWVLDSLLERARAEHLAGPVEASEVCQGTLLSREQYLVDVQEHGFADPRLAPIGTMSPHEVAKWTAAIPSRGDPPPRRVKRRAGAYPEKRSRTAARARS